MTTYRIVVGVDGSEGSLRALLWAVGEAHHRNGSVQAIMVCDRPGTEAALPAGLGSDGELRRAEGVLAKALEGVRGQFEETPIATEAVTGKPAYKLAEASRDADLLVVGSHGHGHLHQATLGSVSEGCVRQAHCPVVVVPTPRFDSTANTDLQEVPPG
ncbi:universal stress protein [Hamadaea tsunoensis]|uniref:universal stress protein n=1 Tax=Hamadaea tsunoensis TaxID=53368 RepID=UPI000417ABE2|nr:universal stress protein [Hamadaea tsunoensis]